MSRDELPAEFSGHLDFDGLVAALAHLEGEEVSIVVADERSGDAGPAGARIEMRGQLHQISQHALPETECFSVGLNPGVRLPRAEFVSASLSTFDVNFYFLIAIQMKRAAHACGWPASTVGALQTNIH
jgi:hypothetical protein